MRFLIGLFIVGMIVFNFSFVFAAEDFEVYKHGLKQAIEGKFDEALKSLNDSKSFKNESTINLANEIIDYIEKFKEGIYTRDFVISEIKGTYYLIIKDSKEAVLAYKEGLTLNPGNALANNNYGVGLMFVGKYEDSIPYFKKAISLDIKLTDPYENLAFIYRGLSNYYDDVYKQAKKLKTKNE